MYQTLNQPFQSRCHSCLSYQLDCYSKITHQLQVTYIKTHTSTRKRSQYMQVSLINNSQFPRRSTEVCFDIADQLDSGTFITPNSTHDEHF